MSGLLARFWRRHESHDEESVTTSDRPSRAHNSRQISSSSAASVQLGQKIHPNLQELVSANPSVSSPAPPAKQRSSPNSLILNAGDDQRDGIIPLKPVAARQRRRPATSPTLAEPTAPVSHQSPSATPESRPPSRTGSIGSSSSHERMQAAAMCTPPLLSKSSPNPPSSWSTFGRKVNRGVEPIPVLIDGSRPRSRSTSRHSQMQTPSSTTESMSEPMASPSVPSSDLSTYTFGRGHRRPAPITVPPMPALDHPAFKTESDGLPETLKEDQDITEFFAAEMDKRPRLSTSLPSLPSSEPRVGWSKEFTSSPQVKGMLSATSPSYECPSQSATRPNSGGSRASRRKRARRSKSAGMLSQQAYGGHASIRESRDVDGRLGYQARVDSSLASGSFGLGSPFLFQTPEPYNLSKTTTDDDNSISHFNTSPTGMSSKDVANTPNLRRSPPGNQKKTWSDESPTPIFTSTQANPAALLMPPSLSVTGPTPETSPVAEPMTPSRSNGKRKADEVEGPGGTPPEARKAAHQKATTFAAQNPRPHRASGNSSSSRSQAPSSFHRSKRARLSGSTATSTSIAGVMSVVGEDHDRPTSRDESQRQNASNTGSWASRASAPYRSQSRTSRRNTRKAPSVAPSKRSLSQASIPISALISPHAPSFSQRSATYHSRDPRKPVPIQSTPWSLNLPERGWRQNGVRWKDGGGSPFHAWMFFLGFVIFPVWYLAGFLVGIPKTREIGAGEAEKGVVLDDPQVEHDAMSWRRRCRFMAVVSLFTYIPFVVCVAIFAPR